jgi:hypothetical protein
MRNSSLQVNSKLCGIAENRQNNPYLGVIRHKKGLCRYVFNNRDP